MGKVVFANFDTYLDLYGYVAQKPRAKNDVVSYLTGKDGRSESTAKTQVRNAVEGKVSCAKVENGIVSFDVELFKESLQNLCESVGLVATIEPRPTKKAKPEDSIATVKDGHSPDYMRMKKIAGDAEGMLKEMKSLVDQKDQEIIRLSEELKKRSSDTILAAMKQKVLVAGSVEVKPEEKFKRDFFLLSPEKLLDVSDLVSRYGGVVDSPYEPVFSIEKELNEENYIRRIYKQLFGGKLLANRVEEQDRFPKVLKEEPEKDKWVKRKSVSKAEIEKNRLESANGILSLTNISNQVKLSLYAAWFDKDDPELWELLEYAGEHGINADYVIRLLEKPREFHNYRTLRGLLMQASKASEAHIKKEAAMELISGEWYVEALYGGEKCKFKMVPVNELERFKKVLLEYHTEEAAEILETILSGNISVAGNGEKNSELFCANSNETDSEVQIKAPTFLHQMEADIGVDCHVPIDDEEVYEQFKEMEGAKDGTE